MPDDLEEAKNLAKAGRKVEARQIATRLVRRQKDNVAAWVVLAQVVDTREQAIDCLKHVLRLEPGHPWATIHLNRLQAQAEQRRAEPPPPPPTPTRKDPAFIELDTPTPPPGSIDEMLRDVPRAPVAGPPSGAELDPLAGTTPWQRPPSTMDGETFDAFREQIDSGRKKGRKQKGAPGTRRRARWLPLVLLFVLFVLIGAGLIFAMQMGLLGGGAGPLPGEEPHPTLTIAVTAEPTEPPADASGPTAEPSTQPTTTEEAAAPTEPPVGIAPGIAGQILFFRDTGGPVSLFLMAADGSAETPLDPGVEARPDLGLDWSHDGSRIAFVGYTDPDGDGLLSGDIFVMNADGSNVLNLTQSAADDTWPEWSPDAQYIAFVTTTDAPHIAIVPASAQPDPAAVIVAAPGSQPAWSPDARTIAFATAGDAGSDIMLLDVACALGQAACEINPMPLTADALGNERPKWSPDGARIAFVSAREGAPDLWTMSADGSGLARLTSTAMPITYLTWSPDGVRIAFELLNVQAGNVDLYTANADGSGASILLGAPTSDSAPAWSPDGQYIAFQSVSPDMALSDIYLIRADGTGLTQLTTDPALDLLPLWQP